jgi:general secretion pathway protein F/type IV pilus assembly protein PilC
MIAAGESTGALADVCTRLTQLLSRQNKLKKQVATALIYPLLLGSFAFAVLILLLTFVVPSIESLFEGRKVNMLTTAVLAASHLLNRYWAVLLLLMGGAIAWVYWKGNSTEGRERIYRFCLKIPSLRNALVRTAIARFTRTMGTLQQGGVPMIDSLRIARKVMRSPALELVVQQAESRIIEGSSLSVELRKEPLIPPLVTRMLAVGEETGAIAAMFHKIADLYEDEVEKSTTRMTALMQPVILLIMGAIVGVVMLAVLIPLTDINSMTG